MMLTLRALLSTSLSLLATVSALAGSAERMVVVLAENDPATSAKLLRGLESCIARTPTAVVSVFGPLRVEQDFTTDPGLVLAGLSRSPSSDRKPSGAEAKGLFLTDRLPSEKPGKTGSLAEAMEVLAESLAPVGSTTSIVLVSPHIVADSTDPNDEIPFSVYRARKALQRAGLRLVAVNTSGPYDSGVKALTEFPGGTYLRYSQRDFGSRLTSAVCAPGR